MRMVITLTGGLDAQTAPAVRAEVDKAAGSPVRQLVLDMSGLAYLSSAGLRTLAYARQKMPPGVRITLVGANDTIARTVRLVGFHYDLELEDSA